MMPASTPLKDKKALPNFEIIGILSRLLRDKSSVKPDEIDQIVRDRRINSLAKQLLEVADCPEDYWTMYRAAAVDIKNLRDWQPLVEKHKPDQGDQDQEPEKEDRRFVITPDKKRLLRLDTIDDIYAAPDAEYLITKILEVATVSLLYGMSGTGKTFTALDLALSVAHGLRWHGRKVKTGPVWYVNTEGKRGLKKRLQAWYKEHPDLSKSPNFSAITWQLDIKENLTQITDTLESLEVKPGLIVFDNFSLCAAGVNQKNQEEVAPVLKILVQIADTYNAHVMLIHHTNKEDDFNGSMAFRNHVDTMIELKKENKSDKNSPILFTSQKARDDEPFSPIRTELKQVVLHTDENTLETITSCVIVDCERPEPETTTPEAQTQMMEVLNAHIKLTCSAWQKKCEEVYQIATATFYRVKKTLDAEGLISTVGPEKTRGTHFALTEKGVKALG